MKPHKREKKTRIKVFDTWNVFFMSISFISLFRSIFFLGAAGLFGDTLLSAEVDDGLALA